MIELTFLKELMLIRQANQKRKECDICHYWYCLNKTFMFQPYVCNRYHDLLMMSMSIRYIAILKIKNGNYHCISIGISKSEATNLVQKLE